MDRRETVQMWASWSVGLAVLGLMLALAAPAGGAEWLTPGTPSPDEGLFFRLPEAQRLAALLRDRQGQAEELSITQAALAHAKEALRLREQEVALWEREKALLERELAVERQMREGLQRANQQLLEANERLLKAQQPNYAKLLGGVLGVVALVILGGMLL